MKDRAFSHFQKGDFAQGLRVISDQYVASILGQPRLLASKPPAWVAEKMKKNPEVFVKWERAVESQVPMLGEHIIQSLISVLHDDALGRIFKPKVMISGSQTFISVCPLCRKKMVPFGRVTPEQFAEELKTGWFRRFIGRAKCSHRLPIDDITWGVIENRRFLNMSE
jgi:uncharacterized membrane protein YgcG